MSSGGGSSAAFKVNHTLLPSSRKVIVFNKTDVAPADFALEWMADFEKFQEALDDHAREQT